MTPERIASLLEEATGLRVTGRHAHVRLDDATGAASLQRAALGSSEHDTLTLAVWPGELKAQAQAFYAGDRAARLLELVADSPWTAEPRPHLGFYGASPPQRLYLTPRLALDAYVEAWSSGDLDRVHYYPRARVRGELLPWLVERGHASPGDLDGLPRFEYLLGRRDAHLRPAVRARREWSLDEAEDLDEADELAAAIRDELALLLEHLDEPPLPVASRA